MSYQSSYNPVCIIDDDTPDDHPLLNGGLRGTEPRDYAANPYCFSAATVPLTDLIPESEWRERIIDMEKSKTDLETLIKQGGYKIKSQKSTNFCWAYGTVSTVEATRAVNGLPYVSLSPAHIACKIKGFRNVGGWSGEALDYLVDYGCCEERLWPNATISRRYDTREVAENALNYRVVEWNDLKGRNFKETMTCLLNRRPVSAGFMFWRHLVMLVRPVILNDSTGHWSEWLGIKLANSWDTSWGDEGYGILKGNRMVPDDQISPRAIVLYSK